MKKARWKNRSCSIESTGSPKHRSSKPSSQEVGGSHSSISQSSSREKETSEMKSPSHDRSDDGSDKDSVSGMNSSLSPSNSTKTLRKKCKTFTESFSVVFETRTLDLDAESEEERDEWVQLFQWLKSKAGSVGSPFNIKHTTHVDLELNWSGENLEEQFEMGKMIGAGTFGRVYRARHKSSGYEVAIKMVPMNEIEKVDTIRREVDILRKSRHKNIVSYFGCWGPSKDNSLWILMERCKYGSIIDVLEMCHKALKREDRIRSETASTITVNTDYQYHGGDSDYLLEGAKLLEESKIKSTDSSSLSEAGGTPISKKSHMNNNAIRRKSRGSMPSPKMDPLDDAERAPSPPPFKHDMREPLNFLTENHIAFIMLQTLEALAYLHEEQNVVHRDVKGRNILVNEYGLVKLSDFGISKDMVMNSKHNSNRGTAHWMSPELVRDETPTYVSDIWSLGITAIELAEGAPPRADLSSFHAMTETANGPSPSLSIPKLWSSAFIHFVKRCLIKDPEFRPQAADLLNHPFVSRLRNVESLFEHLDTIPLAHCQPIPDTADKYEDNYPEIYPDTYSNRSFQKVQKNQDPEVRHFRHSSYPLLPPFKKRRRGFTCCTIL